MKFNLLILILLFCSCGPKIYSFTSSPPVVTQKDSLLLNWKAIGKPVILFSQRTIPRLPNDSLHILEFTLNVTKGKKDAHRVIQVPVLPEKSTDYLVVPVTSLAGDVLIASGVKDTLVWGNARILTISTANKEELTVIHEGIKEEFTASKTSSNAWNGKPYSGSWEIRRKLSPAEKNDQNLIPNRIQIKAEIYLKK